MFCQIQVTEHDAISFETPEALLEWASSEKKFWDWSVRQNDELANAFRIAQFGLLEKLLSNLRDIEGDKTRNNNEIARQIVSDISSKLKKSNFILSNSELGRFIEKVRKNFGRDVALGVAIHHLDPNFFSNSRSNGAYISAAAYWDFRNTRSLESITARQEALSDASIKFLNVESTVLDTIRDEKQRLELFINEREKKAKSTSNSLGKILDSKRKDLEKFAGDTTSELGKQIKSIKASYEKELNGIRDHYETEIATLAPVNYWKKKAKGHALGSVIFGVLFTAYCGLIYHWIISNEEIKKGIVPFIQSWSDLKLPSLGLTVVFVGLIMVLARVIYRMFSIQFHLWNDATERVVMIQTYLSLSKRGHAKEEFLGALFARLFAPSSDGIVREDIGPVSFAESFLPLSGIGKNQT